MKSPPPPFNLQNFLQEKPPTKPLTPTEILRKMLESTDQRDKGIPSPLDEIDPLSLDILLDRIDTGALALDQIPDPNDIAELVAINRRLLEQFNFQIQTGLIPKRQKRTKKLPAGAQLSPDDFLLGNDDE